MITTGVITGRHNLRFLQASYLIAKRWAWVLLGPLIIFGALAVLWEWAAIAGLFWTLAVVPLLFSIEYYRIVLTPGMSLISRPHYVRFCDNMIILDNLPVEGHAKITRTLPLNSVKTVEVYNDSLMLHTPGCDPRWIYIPRSVISQYDFDKLITLLEQ